MTNEECSGTYLLFKSFLKGKIVQSRAELHESEMLITILRF